MSDLGFLPRMLAIKLKHFDVYSDDMPVDVVEGYIREIITDFNGSNLEKQKFEKIEKMAWEIMKVLLGHKVKLEVNKFIHGCFDIATNFYETAKEKRETKG